MCFRIEIWIPSYSGRSNGVSFPRKIFLYDLPVRIYKALKQYT